MVLGVKTFGLVHLESPEISVTLSFVWEHSEKVPSMSHKADVHQISSLLVPWSPGLWERNSHLWDFLLCYKNPSRLRPLHN